MKAHRANPADRRHPGFVELFTPKLVTVLREGYGLPQFRGDAIAGLTVAIVALPLSMAIAIASGVSPERGLYTAIVGGFLVSLLGGSRFQIGGPAGAFIVLVAGTVAAHGIEGLVLATILSGVFLTLVGYFRLGTYIKFIPYPVTVGFTAGIAVIILASQVKDLLGLELSGPVPGPLAEKLPVLWSALGTVTLESAMLSLVVIVSIPALKRWFPRLPGMLFAVAGAAVAVAAFDLPVATIETQFGGIPGSLPLPRLPEFDLALMMAVLPNAVAFTLLGSIESLLSAVVADGMTGRRHRSNCELVGQGVANIASGLFGGICVTGTIARTATNVRAGAHGPVSGMLHALFLLLFILLAAPLAGYIPLAALAGVLAVVAWNMVEKDAIVTLFRTSRGEAAILLTTFLLTIFRDLTEAIVVGFALGSVLFIHRMSKTTAIEALGPFVEEDRADDANGGRLPYDEAAASDPDIVVYRISGVFFFGAAASVGAVFDRMPDTYRALVIDFSDVPFLDSTAANTIEGLTRKAARHGVKLALTGTSRDIRKILMGHGLSEPSVSYHDTIQDAVTRFRAMRADGWR